jgi:DNA-directed RNA polymerase subunit RPC12/RpoP
MARTRLFEQRNSFSFKPIYCPKKQGETPVSKPEWGTKQQCPKCGTRFYDLGKEDPVTCINCGHAWVPEPILKSKPG